MCFALIGFVKTLRPYLQVEHITVQIDDAFLLLLFEMRKPVEK